VVKNRRGADDHLRMALRDRARTPRSEALVDLFARRERPHAGADLPTARKFVGLLGGISAALTVAFLAMAPPTSQSDVAGWPTAILIVALAAAGSRWLVVSRERVGFNQLLMFCYLGLAETAALQWLAGGASPYRALFLLWLGAGVATNTPRRGLAFIVAVVVFGSLPLAYADSQHLGVDIATDALVWVAMGRADLGQTPADDVGRGDEPDNHPSPRGIEIVRGGRRNQCCDDDGEHRPELRREGSPLGLGTTTCKSCPGRLHTLTDRSFGRILRCHIRPLPRVTKL